MFSFASARVATTLSVPTLQHGHSMVSILATRHVIIVREAKGGKDRVVMLPRSRIERRHHCTMQELLYTHVLKVAAGGTASPLDALMPVV